MDSRSWFEVVRFYFRVALFGDPVLRKPKTRTLQPVRAMPLAELRPATLTK